MAVIFEKFIYLKQLMIYYLFLVLPINCTYYFNYLFHNYINYIIVVNNLLVINSHNFEICHLFDYIVVVIHSN